MRHRDFYMAGVRFGWQLPVSRQLAVDYFIDAVPLLLSTDNPIEYRERKCEPQGEMPVICGDSIMKQATAYGFGVNPIGLQLRAFPGGRIQPLLGLTIGAAWYDKSIPDPGAKRLNFMGDLTAAVQLRVGRFGAVVVGVRQHHTSNGGTGRVNPGIDSRVLHVGVTRSLGSRPRP